MLSSFSKYLPDNKHCTITLNRFLNFLSIFVVDELKDSILTCRLTSDGCPATLLQIFEGRMDIMYAYLERDDSQMEIREDGEGISIRYSLTVLKKTVKRQINMPTKKYLLAKASSQSQQKGLWKQWLMSYNDEPTMSKIHCLRLPGWFVNTQKLFLQLGDKLYPEQTENRKVQYSVAMEVNQLHQHNLPRYDLTLGLAHPSHLAALKTSEQANLSKAISLTIIGRTISSRCLQLTEHKIQNRAVQPKSLRIDVLQSEQPEKGLESIGFVIDKQMVNILDKEVLAPMQHLLEKIEDFVPFVILYRSFLHFCPFQPTPASTVQPS